MHAPFPHLVAKRSRALEQRLSDVSHGVEEDDAEDVEHHVAQSDLDALGGTRRRRREEAGERGANVCT